MTYADMKDLIDEYLKDCDEEDISVILADDEHLETMTLKCELVAQPGVMAFIRLQRVMVFSETPHE